MKFFYTEIVELIHPALDRQPGNYPRTSLLEEPLEEEFLVVALLKSGRRIEVMVDGSNSGAAQLAQGPKRKYVDSTDFHDYLVRSIPSGTEPLSIGRVRVV